VYNWKHCRRSASTDDSEIAYGVARSHEQPKKFDEQ